MGGVMTHDGWLTTLFEKGPPYSKVAAILITMQALNARRSGHHVKLDTEYIRRRIYHSARYGAVADCMVACARCGCQATLNNWCTVASMEVEERSALATEMRGKVYTEIRGYLYPCPGEAYAAAVAESPNLPGKDR